MLFFFRSIGIPGGPDTLLALLAVARMRFYERMKSLVDTNLFKKLIVFRFEGPITPYGGDAMRFEP